MHRGMAEMMKMMGGPGKRGPLAGLKSMFGLGGGMPTPEQIAEMQKQAGQGGQGRRSAADAQGPRPAASGLGGPGGPKLPGLPGLGGKSPFPPGFNPFGGKKK